MRNQEPPADLTRPQVAELLGLDPLSVRRLEVDPTSGFPRGVELEPNVLRWRRSDIAAWAARNGGVQNRPARSHQTRVV